MNFVKASNAAHAAVSAPTDHAPNDLIFPNNHVLRSSSSRRSRTHSESLGSFSFGATGFSFLGQWPCFYWGSRLRTSAIRPAKANRKSVPGSGMICPSNVHDPVPGFVCGLKMQLGPSASETGQSSIKPKAQEPSVAAEKYFPAPDSSK